ncbi:DUF6429 family protein [Rhizobium leguminosarum]
MSRLRIALERYIGMRQGLGYKYDGPAKRLSEFVAFMETRGAETITNDLAMEWVTSMGRQPSWSIRLADVRCFAQHLSHFDPLTEVPPSHAVAPARRTKPYIYSEIEIQALLATALSLPPANAMRRWTYHCLFGLIAVAGLRHSEALSLLRADVDQATTDRLHQKGLIGDPVNKSKSLVLTDEGLRRSEELFRKLFTRRPGFPSP